MNKLKFPILLTLGLILTIFHACNEDEFTEMEQSQYYENDAIQYRYDHKICDDFSENFCDAYQGGTDAVAAFRCGNGTKTQFEVKVGRDVFTVQYFEAINKELGLLVKKDNNYYVGLSSTSRYRKTKEIQTDLPCELGKLSRVSSTISTNSHDINIYDIRSIKDIVSQEVGSDFVTVGGKSRITLRGCDGKDYWTWFKPCTITYLSYVEGFRDVFFQAGDASHIEELIEDAFNAANNDSSCNRVYDNSSGNTCGACPNYCIDPRCVVDNLLAIEQGLSDDQKERIVARYLGEVMGLTGAEENWIALGEEDLLFEIYNGLENTQNLGRCGTEDCGMLGGYHEMIIQEQAGANLTTEDKESLVEFFSLLKCDDSELYNCFREAQQNPNSEIAAFLGEIKVALMTDNLALLGGCDDLGQYKSRWYDLANLNPLEVPGISEKLEELGDEYWIQTLENAVSVPHPPQPYPHPNWWSAPPPTVNMDFFGITINELPNNPDTGEPFNSESFFDYIQQNWTTPEFLGQGNECGATFLPISQAELTNWTDGNGLTSTFTIKMPDDGNVICVEHDPGNHWVFATLNAPGWLQYGLDNSWDGYHPVSGNRQFGIQENADGTYTFYTSGVDRLTEMWHLMVHELGFIDAFGDADELWKCLLDTIAAFVNANGGNADTNNYDCTTVRPLWAELREAIRGGCNGFTDSLEEFPCEQAAPCE